MLLSRKQNLPQNCINTKIHPIPHEFSSLKYLLSLTISFQLISLAYNSVQVGEYLKANIIYTEKRNDDSLGKSDVANRHKFQIILKSYCTKRSKTMSLRLVSPM